MELISSEKAMSDFIAAIVPSDIADGAKNNKRGINDLMGYEVVPEETNVTPITPAN